MLLKNEMDDKGECSRIAREEKIWSHDQESSNAQFNNSIW